MYFKINNNDYSRCVNSLKVTKNKSYISQTNAAGDTVIDYLNAKHIVDVGIIPLDEDTMANLLADLDNINVNISFLNPRTKEIKENVNCLVPSDAVDYYTIQADNTLFKAFTIQFTEL